MTQIRYRHGGLGYGMGYQYRRPSFTPPQSGPGADFDHYGALIRIFNGGIKVAELSTDTGNPWCGKCSFDLVPTGCGQIMLDMHDLPSGVSMTHGTRVDVHLRGRVKPIYSGFIQQPPGTGTTDWPKVYRGHGWYALLESLTVSATYTSRSVWSVADALAKTLENVSGGRIRYNAGKIVKNARSKYVLAEIRFQPRMKIKDAFTTLAGLAGGFEFGVDANRDFWFRPPSTTVEDASRLWSGKHVHKLSVTEDSSKLANRIWIRSGQRNADGNNLLELPVEDLASQSTYGLREDFVTAPSVFADTDGYRYGAVQLQQRKAPKQQVQVGGIELGSRIIKCEGYVRVTADDADATVYELPKKRVGYSIDGNGIACTVQVGDEREKGRQESDLLAKAEREELLQQQNLNQIPS